METESPERQRELNTKSFCHDLISPGSRHKCCDCSLLLFSCRITVNTLTLCQRMGMFIFSYSFLCCLFYIDIWVFYVLNRHASRPLLFSLSPSHIHIRTHCRWQCLSVPDRSFPPLPDSCRD